MMDLPHSITDMPHARSGRQVPNRRPLLHLSAGEGTLLLACVERGRDEARGMGWMQRGG